MKSLFKAGVVAVALASVAVPTLAEAQHRRDRDDRRGDRWDRDDRRGDRWDRRGDRRGDRWDRDDRRGDRWDRRGDHWGDRWDRDHRRDRWERRDGWWRGRSDFRDYRGRRSGYWYAPGYGYYSVAPRYHGYTWRRGHVVPAPYRRYYVRDPYFYGLRPAPHGHRWVHVDNNLVLMAIATGVIADIVFDVF